MARREESIYMKRWLSFHHYSSPQQSDFYYLKLCNEIYKMLEDDDFPDSYNGKIGGGSRGPRRTLGMMPT